MLHLYGALKKQNLQCTEPCLGARTLDPKTLSPEPYVLPGAGGEGGRRLKHFCCQAQAPQEV